MKLKKRLGEMLIEEGVIDTLQLNSALGHQRQWGGKLGSVLIQMGFADEHAICSVLEKQLGERCISLENAEISQKALNAVKHEIAKKYCIMPINLDRNVLSIAISDPTDVRLIDELSFLLGLRIKPVLAIESDIKNAIAKHYEGETFTGKTYKAAIEKISDSMQMIKPESAIEQTTEPMQIIRPESDIKFARDEPREKPAQQKAITSKSVIEAIASLLIEKGIITREELSRKIKEKSS